MGRPSRDFLTAISESKISAEKPLKYRKNGTLKTTLTDPLWVGLFLTSRFELCELLCRPSLSGVKLCKKKLCKNLALNPSFKIIMIQNKKNG